MQIANNRLFHVAVTQFANLKIANITATLYKIEDSQKLRLANKTRYTV